MDSTETANSLPISAGKVLIIGQPQCLWILIQILLESILCPGPFQIVLAPFPVGSVKPPGTGIGSVFPSHISGRIQESNDIVLIFHQIFQVLPCPVADAEFKSVPDQTVQALQTRQ